jgi:hypothetical protein
VAVTVSPILTAMAAVSEPGSTTAPFGERAPEQADRIGQPGERLDRRAHA